MTDDRFVKLVIWFAIGIGLLCATVALGVKLEKLKQHPNNTMVIGEPTLLDICDRLDSIDTRLDELPTCDGIAAVLAHVHNNLAERLDSIVGRLNAIEQDLDDLEWAIDPPPPLPEEALSPPAELEHSVPGVPPLSETYTPPRPCDPPKRSKCKR